MEYIRSEVNSLGALNSELEKIEQVLSTKVGIEDTANRVMQADLDLNSHKLLNVPVPVNPTDVVRLLELETYVAENIDDALRLDLASANSTVLVGGVEARSLKLFDGIKQLVVSEGADLVVKGFYTGSSIGGGSFIYDPTVSKSLHDGGVVIAPEAISAWDGTHTNLSTLLNWSGTGSGCFVRQLDTDEVCTSFFGAKNGLDCTLSLNKAGAYGKANSVGVVNDVPVKVTAAVYFYTWLDCKKKITCDTLGCIYLSHDQDAITVTPDLANMIRGAALSGVSGYLGGTLVIQSEEKLIDRVGNAEGGEPYYKKEETSEIVSESGVISPMWMHTYTTLTGLTAKVYPAERRTKSFIDTEYVNPSLSNFAVVRVNKSNVDLDLRVSVTGDKTLANVALFAYDCINLTVRPVISGFQSTLGYGIHALRVANFSSNYGDVTECRRPIANRMDKHTRVWKGFYRSSGSVSPIDTHWTDDIVVDDVLGYCKGLAILDFAGYNATVRNCTLVDALGVIGNRPDTPCCGGKVIIENNEIKNTREVFAYFFSKSIGEDYAGAFDWELPWPDLIRIKNNIVNISDSNWSLLRLNDSRFSRTQIKHIDVANNTYLSDLHPTGIIQLGSGALDTHPLYTTTVTPKIHIANQTFQPGTTYGIAEIARQGASWKWELRFTDVYDLYFRLDEDVASKVELIRGNFIGSRVKTFRLSTDPAKVPTFMFDMRGVTVTSGCLLYGSSNLIMAFNCIFESGAMTYSNDTSDQQPLSANRQTAFAISMGNVANLPVTSLGSLPPLDGWYLDTKMYSRMAIAKHNNGAIGTSDLGPYGIGYRDDIESIVIMNAAGAVRKIATTA